MHTLLYSKTCVGDASGISEFVIIYNSINFSHSRVEIDKMWPQLVDDCQEKELEIFSLWYISIINHST